MKLTNWLIWINSFPYLLCVKHKTLPICLCSSFCNCCVCVKRITLCNCLCSSSFPYSRFSTSLIRNIGEFRAKKDFTDHRTANAIKLLVPMKTKIFGSILFQNKSQRREIFQRLLDTYSHLFICMSLKQALGTSFCFLHINQ